MKHENLDKNFTMRISVKDFEKLTKLVGPFGKVGALVRFIIEEYLKKIEKAQSKAA